MSEAPIHIEGLNHAFGEGELRRQVLSDISLAIGVGEIVILTGPSGSGKTTLLTLIGALRSAREGSVRVLGQELRGAGEATLAAVRRRIGYVFQAHNLLDSLTAGQNVAMSLQLERGLSGAEMVDRSTKALEAVGLGDRVDSHPGRLSGGQRQRVAIARALVRRPDLLLADEPTASLDRKTGRSVVELLEKLARQERVTVVLVTHDNRILDVADRIITLEDGRLTSLMRAVTGQTGHLLNLLARDVRRGELGQRLASMDAAAFEDLLAQVTEETQSLLGLVDLVQGEAFEDVLGQVAEVFLRKVADLLPADRTALVFFDGDAGRRWSAAPGEATELREVSDGRGIASEVARDGRVRNVATLEREGAFDASVDVDAGGGRGSLLAVPVTDSKGGVFAVVEAARHADGPFEDAEEQMLRELTVSLSLVLESWWRMSSTCRASVHDRTCPCCGNPWRRPVSAVSVDAGALSD